LSLSFSNSLEVLMDDCSLLLLLLLLFSLSVILLFSIRSGVPVSEEWLSMSHESKELLLSISLLFELLLSKDFGKSRKWISVKKWE
jgi:hypothetical protein